MAQTNEIVTPGPGWADIAGDGEGYGDASLFIIDNRFGPATIASIKALAVSGLPEDYVEVGVELTLGDARAIVAALQPIIRQAILDGYADGAEVEGERPEAAPFDEYEIAECGELPEDAHGIKAVERLVGDEDRSDYTKTFWTVYGYRRHTDAHLDGEGATALFDADTLAEALEVGRLLGAPVYLDWDGIRELRS